MEQERHKRPNPSGGQTAKALSIHKRQSSQAGIGKDATVHSAWRRTSRGKAQDALSTRVDLSRFTFQAGRGITGVGSSPSPFAASVSVYCHLQRAPGWAGTGSTALLRYPSAAHILSLVTTLRDTSIVHDCLKGIMS